MCFSRPALLPLLAVLSCSSAFAQQPPPRDPQALAVLQHSFTAMGGAVPADSVATGNVVLVEGSKTTSGTIRILTRGLDQSAEHMDTPGGRRSLIYSQGQANAVEGTTLSQFSLELAASSQSPNFPLLLLAGALNNPDAAFQYLGIEAVGTAQAHHLRFWNTFSSSPKLAHLAAFSAKNIWIDIGSGLPIKLTYDRRAGGGAEPRIPIEVHYSDYRNAGGVLYPFLIETKYNGTPWVTTTISSVNLNTGLSEAAFSVQ